MRKPIISEKNEKIRTLQKKFWGPMKRRITNLTSRFEWAGIKNLKMLKWLLILNIVILVTIGEDLKKTRIKKYLFQVLVMVKSENVVLVFINIGTIFLVDVKLK